MRRLFLRGAQFVLDLLVLSVAFWLAFVFRFGFSLDLSHYKLIFFTWPYVILLQYGLLVLFGVSRYSWRYIGLRETQRILIALASSTAVLATLRLAFADATGYAKFVRIPLGVLVLNLILAFLGVVGIRVLRRLQDERVVRSNSAKKDHPAARTILIGAGRAGVAVVKEISQRPSLGIEPVAFVDDDPMKVGQVMHGVKVVGSSADLPELARSLRAKQAIITIATATGKDIQKITSYCKRAGLETQIIPSIFEIVGGQVNLSRLRPVAIEDLLGRERVSLNQEAISKVVKGRVVVITGAGGSIGSELCRQIVGYEPSRLVLLEQAENALYEIHRELRREMPGGGFPRVEIVPCVANVRDESRIDGIFAHHSPDIIFHAAAHKHVPMMEWNPCEAVKNNVEGTRIVADLASRHGVSEFVLVSTDKAVNPTSIMGASKRMAEIYIQALSQRSKTCFMAVRFGNVLGSSGSVVPLFQEQIANGGPVTLTDPKMTRYFMTIPEACQLVLQAGAMGQNGKIFILDMGTPVKILDLAENLIKLSGLRPHVDIEIVTTRVRPGEKLFEELSVTDENVDKTHHPKIFVGRVRPHPFEQVSTTIDFLLEASRRGNSKVARQLFHQAIPEYQDGPGSLPLPEEIPAQEMAGQAPAPSGATRSPAAGTRIGRPATDYATAATPPGGMPAVREYEPST